MRRLSDEQLLTKLKVACEQLGRSIKYDELQKDKSLPSASTYESHFGSFSSALELVGYKDSKTKYTKEDLIRYLQKHSKDGYVISHGKLDQIATEERNGYWGRTFEQHFGTFNKAAKAAGLRLNKTLIDKTEMIEALEQLHKQLNRVPKLSDIDDSLITPSSEMYRTVFGGLYKALEVANIPFQKTPRAKISKLGKRLERLVLEVKKELGETDIVYDQIHESGLKPDFQYSDRWEDVKLRWQGYRYSDCKVREYLKYVPRVVVIYALGEPKRIVDKRIEFKKVTTYFDELEKTENGKQLLQQIKELLKLKEGS